ncbi:MAG: acyl-CoA dehydrogenase [Planctomycetota bacterium]|nr:acyl-CoA dehydrogenase [Planctomycetota bacterium]
MFSWIIQLLKKNKMLPTISDTERAALEAGTVWVERDLFSGRPNFHKLMAESYPQINEKEKAFLDGPVEELCNLVSPWELIQLQDLPEHVWAFLRKHRFFGLMIPEEYGGHGFSSLGFSAVIGKLGTHSMILNSIVIIPNSIGPAELIWHYGTQAQKDRYLEPLAHGKEIPAFALTEPHAGSDAASLTSSGTLFKRQDGSLAIRLNWNKRYITLAPIATLLGLAFQLYDPENLLGKGTELGITCALVHTDLPGVEQGNRHDPMGSGFPNGPTRGHDVIIDAEQIIGGLEYAGKGWIMLMEALSGGRALSLPASATAGVKGIAHSVGAYAHLRKQFGVSIGKFEGIQEPLARLTGKAYLMDAVRVYTCGAIERGEKPSVVSAIVKYQLTELGRQCVIDGMDIVGGKGISRGPNNLLAEGYTAAPIGITVEGANILTRTLIVFGQGALRCHPYLYREVKAIENEDAAELRRSLFGHAFFGMGNLIRAGLYSLTRGRLASAGPLRGPSAHYARKIAWASSIYSLLADLVIITSGPELKQRGKISGRFADALSWMFQGTATLRRFQADGCPEEDLPLLHWGMQTSLQHIQKSLEGVFQNFGGILSIPVRFIGGFLMRLNPLSGPPSDELVKQVAETLLKPSDQRDRLTEGIFLPEDPNSIQRQLDRALTLSHATAPISHKIRKAIREGLIEKGTLPQQLETAVAKEICTQEEAQKLIESETLRDTVLQVDEFTPEEFPRHRKDFHLDQEKALASSTH